jgi:hypothetical protein
MIAFLAQHNLLGTIQFAECISNSSASLLSHISWYGAPKKKKKDLSFLFVVVVRIEPRTWSMVGKRSTT